MFAVLPSLVASVRRCPHAGWHSASPGGAFHAPLFGTPQQAQSPQGFPLERKSRRWFQEKGTYLEEGTYLVLNFRTYFYLE